MDPPPAMDKKAVVKGPNLPSKNVNDPPVKDYGFKKAAQYSRKKEWDRPDPGKKPVGGRGGRAGQRYVRPREKTGGQVGSSDLELGSLYRTGGKKQNITHLMNWWAPSYRGPQKQGPRTRRPSSHTPKYTKEHYLQANCQFVVREGEDYSVYLADPDLLVEWRLVEQVRIHVVEPPACPICLHPPTAAKITRCGHMYCYPCILHYLALSDDKWRHCPICYVPIEKDELRSVRTICHREFSIGEEIELQLMRRERDSLVAVPAAAYCPSVVKDVQRLAAPNAATPFAKLLLASKEEVCSEILSREERDLIAQLVEEGDQPEACFIDDALSLIQNRQKAMREDQMNNLEAGLDTLSLSSPDDETSKSSSESFSEDSISLGSPVDEAAEDLPSPLVDPPELPLELQQSTVTAEDLDISQLQPANKSGQASKNAPKSTFYFYQASNGAHVYLHTLNTHMLVSEYGDLVHCPPVIRARLLEKEPVLMTEELRQKLRYLGHLPVASSFYVVEVDLREPVVSKLTLATYQEQIEQRQHKRKKRAREERRIEKRVRAEEDRMMGRSRGATNLKVDSYVHFPSFAEDNNGRESHGLPVPVNNDGVEAAASSPGDSLYGSSTDTTGSGMSFAKMIREGQTRVHPVPSEPVVSASGAWPTLGGKPAKPAWPEPTQNKRPQGGVNCNNGSGWGVKGSSGGRKKQPQGDDDDDDEEGVPVPEFRHAFSDAIAKAFDKAARNVPANAEVDSANVGGKKNKKNKKKKVLLFSSGGFN